MARLCNLSINASGSWKSIVTFDIDKADTASLFDAAVTIAQASHHERKPSLRVAMADGLATPLMHWTPEHGWKDWNK